MVSQKKNECPHEPASSGTLKIEIENVKRIKAVKIEPTANGLTIVGGNNNQGKTSVLDSIAWALGGEKYRPSKAQREGSTIPPTLHIVLNNGLVVERKGKNSALKVTDPNGGKGGQQLLNEFVEQLALDLPRFMESSGKEKAQTLLKIIGVGDQLEVLDRKEKELYNNRLSIGQIADRKKKFADEQPYYPEAPKELISPSELIRQQQEILARNGENQRKREQVEKYKSSVFFIRQSVDSMREQLEQEEQRLKEAEENLRIAQMNASDLQDESTAELEESLSNIEEINRKVRANMDKDKAEEDALDYRNQYNSLTAEIDKTRRAKTDLLQSAELPLPELSVKDGELIYNGQQWDNMSGSDRLKVSTAIVDIQTLNEFGQWLEQEGLQAIATRVSTGDECSIIIEDGYIQDPVQQPKTWKEGTF